MLRGECCCLRNFLGLFGLGDSESGDLKLEEFCHAISGRISKYWDFLMNYILLCRNGSTRITNFFLSWLEWKTRIVDPSCKINFLWRHRNEREAINSNSILSNFSRQKKAINFAFKVFQPATYSDEKTSETFFTRFEPGVGDSNPPKPCKIFRSP